MQAGPVVVSLGGNAITRAGDQGTVDEDYRNLEGSLECVVHLLQRGFRIALTHGNGPQVGNLMIRVELARHEAPVLPLDVMIADVQGGLGYMIARVLQGQLRQRGMLQQVCCLLTMVEVEPDDPAFREPTKFVGPAYIESESERLCRERGWQMKPDSNRGWRRVVPSPRPVAIVERASIAALLDAGFVVIAAGGGGIPVARTPAGDLVGVSGVVDKDLSSAVLGRDLGAADLVILTAVSHVALDHGTPRARPLARLAVSEARQHLLEGHFPAGSMGPKIEAACQFLETGGKRVLITDAAHVVDALDGQGGTWIIP